ncbi:MAG: hypothetical protein A2X13_12100 [Bacteroidetes bacterium GWC2_33_15]|nr:MAG: hypothetical protein A2X10_06125 [Bacteroidetes bacterium GWA2_33_15]OFX50876.1 MAG: hypothetical protein A2X13_12100 [Bacteroidetes bacterium GWC2_33_15]OFX62841.1 MAG: hypothetical protein A2X15_09270 [Bacteroidetes bacterium GWB2_32_14]OFX69911.1 MAG: hypothetical protein A2X14_02130 [Bacteroidetes bacterium GWD2_33_33]HAN18902.1 hypothetical protein [Bacteroidales bacterium]
MKKNTIFTLILIFLLFSVRLKAQFYSTGQDPANVKWKQIKTEHFQIIFGSEFAEDAGRIANILEYYYTKAGKSLEHQPKKISVILHNQTVRSNGYVAWAPKRMELYTTPPQDILPDPWLEHLCLHELRHVVQLDKLNQGITRVLALVFGEQFTGLVAGQLPMWFYEGDAVCTETALGNYGRGRSPLFLKNIKTHLLSDEKIYTFDQMLFGSYNAYIPNQYEFGYLLTAYARTKYGNKSWSLVENHVAKNSYTLFPTPFMFSRGVKKQTGKNQKNLYCEAINYLDSVWAIENLMYETVEPKFFQNYTIKGYENYINPVYVDDKNILALKTGLSHIPQFVFVNPDEEKIIHEPGTLISDDFSYSKNFIVWAEYKPDKRWQNREFTSIKMYNMSTKKERVTVRKGRYFSPAISEDANKIVVVEVSPENEYFLTIISSFNGTVIQRIPSDNFIQRPKWSDDGKDIFVIEHTPEGKQISKYNIEDNLWEVLYNAGNNDIQRITPAKNSLFYLSDENGQNEVNIFDINNNKSHRISASRNGITDFCINPNRNILIVSEHTSQGSRLAAIPVERGSWAEVPATKIIKPVFVDKLAEQENNPVSEKSIPQNQYSVKSYSKFANVFNFHSWVPFYFDYEETQVNSALSNPDELLNNLHPGIMLLSQNKLSTAESVLSYAYKNDHHYFSTSFTYKGFYPVLKFAINYGDFNSYFAPENTYWNPELDYNAISYNFDIYVPLTFSEGSMQGGIIPRVNIDFRNTFYYNYLEDYYIKGNEFVQSELIIYYQKKRASRDLQPRVGAMLDINLFNTPFEEELFGYMSNIKLKTYLPGFFTNHGIELNLGYQVQKPDLYLFNSNLSFPRGITKFRTEKLASLYFDYVFPIAYPDWSIGPLLYIKRFKGDLFFDYAFNSFQALNESENQIYWAKYNMSSFGAELTADFHLLRMIFPFNSGIRVGYTPFTSEFFYQAIFEIDLVHF